MSLENFGGPKQKIEKDPTLVLSGIGEDGLPQYEELSRPLPTNFPTVPQVVFDMVRNDLDNLPECSEKLKFRAGEMLEIAINSNQKVLYEIIEAPKGHYFLGKYEEGRTIKNGVPGFEVILSGEPKDASNPDIIICSANELEGWLKG